MALKEITGKLTPSTDLRRGQIVHVLVGAEDLGTGRVDAVADDGTVWVFFGGPSPRRLFIEEDEAQFRVQPPA
jgi:hypothetical protein